MRFIVLSCALVALPSFAGDWPNFLGPQRDGISTERLAGEIGDVVWQAQVGIGFSGVMVANGRAYTMGHKGGKETVYCFDAKTGSVIWQQSYEAKLLPRLHEGGPSSSPTIFEGHVYTVAKDGQLFCWDAKTGERRWQRNLRVDAETNGIPEWGFCSSGLILGDWIIYMAGATIAYNRADGSIAWKSTSYRPGYGSPALFEQDGEQLLATLNTDGLTILKAKDGSTVAHSRWRTSFQTNANTPIIADGTIFISTGYKRGCGMFKLNGGELQEVYTNKTFSNHMNNSVLVDGHLYGFDGNTHGREEKFLVCVEWATGKEKWREKGMLCGTVRVAGDKLVVLSEIGELLIAPVSASGFKPAARKTILSGRCWTAPVLANGLVYARNAQGKLVCVAVK